MQQRTAAWALSDTQRQEARELWSELMLAPTTAALNAAREKLRNADGAIRLAVTEANVRLWQQGEEAKDVGNPFE